MSTSFKDLFSRQSTSYAKFRPDYPDAIFEFAASLPETATPAGARVAWDCATGSGQAAKGLAPRFARVIATDASQAQLSQAAKSPAIEYRVAPAESSGLADASVDLVNVAQALHWFRIPEFFAEARRVLRPGGAVLVFGYARSTIAPAVDPIVMRYTREIVGPYWAPEVDLVETHYRTIDFPFDELPAPQLEMFKEWNLDELEGYLDSWSSTQKYIELHGRHPLEQVDAELRAAWGDPKARRPVRFELFSRAGRV